MGVSAEARSGVARNGQRIIVVMSPLDADADARRDARLRWPLAAFRLGEEPSDDLSDRTTPEERIAMMWSLAVDAWAVSGRALPQYTRDQMPGRLIRRSSSHTAPER